MGIDQKKKEGEVKGEVIESMERFVSKSLIVFLRKRNLVRKLNLYEIKISIMTYEHMSSSNLGGLKGSIVSDRNLAAGALVLVSVPFLYERSETPFGDNFGVSGDILQQRRIFTNEDVVEYSKVSQDSNPLHFDDEFAKTPGFQGRIVHGMLVASLFPQIISSHFPGAVYVSQSLQFRQPVYVGEEILGEVQATNIRAFKKNYLCNTVVSEGMKDENTRWKPLTFSTDLQDSKQSVKALPTQIVKSPSWPVNLIHRPTRLQSSTFNKIMK
ncbi:uncharacterized protein LOC130824179 [Amaranthus tricolor]|uniref:uncharacterized protein LOC130824179 n=1 Tax=Amaranthus tricolor TaxID=29722 RepID=UPI00258DC53D|nr:uncharacterized protein LOC130824179 [Amaranthus tricolor]